MGRHRKPLVIEPRDLALLHYIYAYQPMHYGLAPRHREISAFLGVAQGAGIATRMRRLLDLGLLTKEPGEPRILHVTLDGYHAMGVRSPAERQPKPKRKPSASLVGASV